MLLRNDYIQEIINTINANQRVINIHGERGIGKSYIISQLKKRLAEVQNSSNSTQYLCGIFDFNNYVGLSENMTINALYDLCDFLVAKKTIALYHFNVADRIDSDRNHRIPYSDRKILSGLDISSEISDLVSDFVELPYIGAGLKMAKFTAKLALKHKPKSKEEIALYEKYKLLSDDEIREKLPLTLATDINTSIQKSTKDIRLIIIIDNYNETTLSNKSVDWLNKLITDTDNNICWLFVSRERIQTTNIPIHNIPISPLTSDEMKHFLIQEKNLTDEAEINSCIKLCAGNPLRVERVLEFITQQRNKGSIDWSVLEKLGYEYIALETLKTLSTERKEMLFQLNFANTFDEDIFCHIFPGKLFSIYHEWFNSSLFTQKEPEKYCVQNSMKEEITNYMHNIDETLASECYYNLFKAEYSWFQRQETLSKATIGELGQHMQNLFTYGKNIKSTQEYLECLIDVRNILINSGYIKNYLDELVQLSKRTDSYLKLIVLKEIATLSLYISDYQLTREAMEDGLSLSEKFNDINLNLEFASIKMNLEYIAPANDSNAVSTCIDIANDYIKKLESNIKNIPYKTYITNMVKVKLYLAKEYLIRKDYENATTCLNYIFNLCSDPTKLNVLSLYSSLAKAQEQMGELYAAQKECYKSIESYQNAVETYQVAEILQPFWDGEFYLNFGLVYNLSSENHLNHELYVKKALENLNNALSKYQEVKERIPELIDTYCKMGFAYITVAEKLWQDDRWNDEVEMYLSDAASILDQAIQQINSNVNGKTDGNRQIANSRCIISRISALYNERKGNYSVAEGFFRQTLTDGDYAIHTAPNHPYGHMEAATGYLAYSSFLLNHNRISEAKQIILTGLEIIKNAESFINSSIGFKDIRENLELNLTKCN